MKSRMAIKASYQLVPTWISSIIVHYTISALTTLNLARDKNHIPSHLQFLLPGMPFHLVESYSSFKTDLNVTIVKLWTPSVDLVVLSCVLIVLGLYSLLLELSHYIVIFTYLFHPHELVKENLD